MSVIDAGAAHHSKLFFHRESLIVGLLSAAMVAGILVWTVSTRGFHYVLGGDAQHFYRVALDPFGNGQLFVGAPPGAGDAYRYGRILYPLLAWLLALGHVQWISWTMEIVYVATAFLMGATAAEYCLEQGKNSILGLIVFLVPATWITLPVLVPQMLEVGLIITMYILVLRMRRNSAKVVAAFLLLTRETAGLAILPLILRSIRLREFKEASTWILTAAPIAIWWTFVRVRVGHFPPMDPVVSSNHTLALPWHGFLSWPFSAGSSRAAVVASLMGLFTIVLALWFEASNHTFPITSGAVTLSMLLLFKGKGLTPLPGEDFRLMMSAQVLVALAWATQLGRNRVAATQPT